MTTPIRLSKRLADLHACSRREAELYIEGGWVQVDGHTVQEPQHRVLHETITLASDARADPIPPATLIWHRPHTTTPCTATHLQDTAPSGPASQRVLRRHFLHQQAAAPLDDAGTGLVVFTQDPRIHRRLHEDAALLEQEFMVELPGQLTNEAIEQLAQRLQQARLWPQVPVIGKVSLNARGPQGTRLRFALKGSSAARVHTLCTSSGLRPTAVLRTRIGRLALAKLAPGQWRFLTPYETF